MTGPLTGSWSRAGIAPAPVCNLVPGVMLRGANIAPKAAHVASGAAYRTLFAEWDWAGWIKPQVDALHSVGGNCVRLIGDLQGVNDGTFSQATYDSRWDQLATYLAGLGMYLYPAGGGVSQVAAAGLTPAQIGSSVAAMAAAIDAHANVIGIDVLQESVRQQVSGSYALSYPSEITTPIRAVSSLPLTFSSATDTGGGRFTFPLWKQVLRPYVDFWDVHVYFHAAPNLFYEAFWGQGDVKPILIGEYGAPASDGTATQDRRFDAVAAVVNNRMYGLHVAGVFQWAIFDQGTSTDAWGMFDTDGTPRSHLTSRFQQLPTS